MVAFDGNYFKCQFQLQRISLLIRKVIQSEVLSTTFVTPKVPSLDFAIEAKWACSWAEIRHSTTCLASCSVPPFAFLYLHAE